jgi:long-chain fatty acid transport protein
VRLAAIGLALAALPARLWASGFMIQEQSGRALGNAFVGEAAAAEDASTIWFNPAGLTRLEGTQLVFGGHLILPQVVFDDAGSTLSPAVGGGRLRGDEAHNAGGVGLVPTAYLAHQISDRWRVGLGVNVPFGLRTNWNRTWVGRYHAILSELKTVDVAPTFAVRVVDGLSLGGGLDIQYARATLSNMLDMGSLCLENAERLGVPSAFCGALGLNPQSVDGFVRIKGDSWAVGGNVGLLWEPTSRTRVGLAYRSRIDHTLEGEADFEVPKKARVLRQASGALEDTGGRADLNLPDSVRFDIFHRLSTRWSIQTGVQWTHWARFEELRFEFDNPRQPTVVDPQNWDDTFRWGVATQYRPARGWVARLGFAYDYSPVPGPSDRTPRIPDADRVWLATGVGYQLTSNLVLDAGYAHLFAPTAHSRRADPITGHVLIGTYSADADIFGGQLTWFF